jgi:putative transposase
MAQSLAQILTHIIFSTKGRRPMIPPELREELSAYFVGILREWDSPAIQVNNVPDHVHVLCCLSKNHALAKVVEEIKTGTSKWLKRRSPDLSDFHWQNGYGAFSVSQSHVRGVRLYISRQEQRHKKVSFEEEFREILNRSGVEYDEKFVWD